MYTTQLKTQTCLNTAANLASHPKIKLEIKKQAAALTVYVATDIMVEYHIVPSIVRSLHVNHYIDFQKSFLIVNTTEFNLDIFMVVSKAI